METASSRMWTPGAQSISKDDCHYNIATLWVKSGIYLKKKKHFFGVIMNLFLFYDDHHQVLNEKKSFGCSYIASVVIRILKKD